MRIIRRLREGIRETLSDEVQLRAVMLPCGCVVFLVALFLVILVANLLFPIMAGHRGNVLRAILDLLGF